MIRARFEFEVTGRNLEELEERATARAMEFISQSTADRVEWDMDARSYVESGTGETVLWKATVTATASGNYTQRQVMMHEGHTPDDGCDGG